ncbi:MAG: DUF2799 domain-containing protein [Wenzhouxiangella sp.]
MLIGKCRPIAVGLIMLAAASLMNGCATMSPEECMVADWYRLGDLDARSGRDNDYLAQRAGDCAEAGYPADTDAWYRGYKQGLSYFCTIDNGFRHGLDGNSYQRTCPGQFEDDFLDGYELGQSIHALTARVASSRQELDRLNQELGKLQREEYPDREAIRDLREASNRVNYRLRSEEVELASTRGVARGRGFRLPK